jgi:hypothetical protein
VCRPTRTCRPCNGRTTKNCETIFPVTHRSFSEPTQGCVQGCYIGLISKLFPQICAQRCSPPPPAIGRTHALALMAVLHSLASSPDSCNLELTPSPIRMWQNPTSYEMCAMPLQRECP